MHEFLLTVFTVRISRSKSIEVYVSIVKSSGYQKSQTGPDPTEINLTDWFSGKLVKSRFKKRFLYWFNTVHSSSGVAFFHNDEFSNSSFTLYRQYYTCSWPQRPFPRLWSSFVEDLFFSKNNNKSMWY